MKRYPEVSFQYAREKKTGNDPRPETLIPETTAMVIKEAERKHSFWNAFSLLLFGFVRDFVPTDLFLRKFRSRETGLLRLGSLGTRVASVDSLDPHTIGSSTSRA
jgi:hypothetical protein